MSASNEDDDDVDDEGDDDDHRQVTADPETLAPTNQLDSRAITWLQSLGGEVSLVLMNTKRKHMHWPGDIKSDDELQKITDTQYTTSSQIF